MINLLYESLPETIAVDGEDYLVNTDYKYWIELSDALNDTEVDNEYLANVLKGLFLDKIPQFSGEVFLAIMDFFNGNVKNTKNSENGETEKKKKKVYDFKIDAEYFISAFLNQYNINLFEDDLHWWKFLALFNGLEKCELTERIYYRSVDLSTIKSKEERKRIKKIQDKLKLDDNVLSDEDIGGALW